MKTTHRNYSEADGDFNQVCRFIVDLNAGDRFRTTWCLGRIVDWKYGLYENKLAYTAFCDQNAHLWFDGFGELAGIVISESGDAGFEILTLEGYRFLFDEMLHWVLENWRGRDANFSTEVTEFQPIETRILESCGFQRISIFFTRRFDLSGELMPRVPLEQGYTIVDMAANSDFRAQGLLRADAFQGKSSLSEEELARHIKFYNYSHSGPIYHPEVDLCVMAEDGSFVSGCEGLIDARNVIAEVERVCTHSRYRKRGFARAVIQECLYRLKNIGIRDAYITGYSPEAIALYGSLGAVDEVKAYIYELPNFG